MMKTQLQPKWWCSLLFVVLAFFAGVQLRGMAIEEVLPKSASKEISTSSSRTEAAEAMSTYKQTIQNYREEISQDLKRLRPQPCYLNRPWFHIKWGKTGLNFGDDLNLDLAAALLQIPREKVFSTTNRYLQNKIMGIGSVATQTMPGDIVLGTGLSFASKDAQPASPLWSVQLPNATILSVRGPDTRNAILARGIHCPEIYGDLGVTASLLIWPDLNPSENPSKKVCIVPHGTDTTLKKAAKASGYDVLSITPTVPLILAKQLMDCEFIITSSLHVQMIASAFQIGVRWYNGPDSNSPAKYLDYYRGIGATSDITFATSMAHALELGPMKPALTLDTMRSVTLVLLRQFPFDQVCK